MQNGQYAARGPHSDHLHLDAAAIALAALLDALLLVDDLPRCAWAGFASNLATPKERFLSNQLQESLLIKPSCWVLRNFSAQLPVEVLPAGFYDG